MNSSLKIILTWLSAILIVGVLAFLTLVVKVDYTSDIPAEPPVIEDHQFDPYPIFRTIDRNQVKESFPYEAYLKNANLRQIASLQEDMKALDSIVPGNEMGNQEVMSIALTEMLEKQQGNYFNTYQPDSLIHLLQWAERYGAYAEVDAEHSILFAVVYEYWMNFIANNLREQYDARYDIKYGYKFRYLTDRLRERRFNTPVRGTYFEKTINKLLEQNWTYLFNKFWHATGMAYKLMVLALVFVVLFPYFYIVIKLRRKRL